MSLYNSSRLIALSIVPIVMAINRLLLLSRKPAAAFPVRMERECFTDEPHYYSTALHELAHWTGAKHRLNRLTDNQPFGSPAYASEEIRADLASLFMSAELGIPYDPKDQASYIQSWIKVLKMM